MGICDKLRSGLDLTCKSFARKYYQQVVLVNRSDVKNKIVVLSTLDINGNYICRNRAFFDLLNGKTGYRFSVNENSTQIFGVSEKSIIEGIPQYQHSVNVIIKGVDEETKCLLAQLDSGDYFAALQYYDGTIELFGFEYGLSTSGYSYDPANLEGGAIIKLVSMSGAYEDEHPLVYKNNSTGNEIEDFDNNFVTSVVDLNGDFNNDFNADFNNQ